MREAWQWLQHWGGVVLAGVLGVVTLGWYTRRKRAQLGVLKDALAVERAKNRINVLHAKREFLVREEGAASRKVAALDEEIAINHQAIIDAHDVPRSMTEEDIEHALREILGR